MGSWLTSRLAIWSAKLASYLLSVLWSRINEDFQIEARWQRWRDKVRADRIDKALALMIAKSPQTAELARRGMPYGIVLLHALAYSTRRRRFTQGGGTYLSGWTHKEVRQVLTPLLPANEALYLMIVKSPRTTIAAVNGVPYATLLRQALNNPDARWTEKEQNVLLDAVKHFVCTCGHEAWTHLSHSRWERCHICECPAFVTSEEEHDE